MTAFACQSMDQTPGLIVCQAGSFQPAMTEH
jgi:hypothetical protein